MPRILYFFALCNLVIGSGAFVLTGILQPMALELGIHIAAAGQVMTAYAIATAVLAPLLILLTAKWPRKRAIQLGLGLFAAGNLVSALSASLALLLMGRVLMGAGAMFTAAVAAYAVTLVAPALRGRALSTVFLGMSISYAVALPIGAWLGFEYGWHTPVWLCAAASLAALLAASVLLPKGVVTFSTVMAAESIKATVNGMVCAFCAQGMARHWTARKSALRSKTQAMTSSSLKRCPSRSKTSKPP